jgi:hypothetical protein
MSPSTLNLVILRLFTPGFVILRRRVWRRRIYATFWTPSQIALALAVILFFSTRALAGGPKYVAGASFFDSSMTGQPLTWPAGVITYYTDQGDLSPILPNTAANAFVANSFSQWTAVPTAALTALSGGQLAEDVNGSNVYVNANGTITMPADIQPTATGTPVGIVYDFDGSVTDALLGAGAGDSTECFYNAAYGSDDNFGPGASFLHALIVLNGQCALASSQLVDLEYRFVRVIGTVAGLDWSQLNLNVVTGTPPATTDDYAGFPVMHFTDPTGCVPITRCYANPYQLAPDDIAAISRLYPVTAQNQANFSGKQILASTTGRIFGSVWFTDSSGNPTQPMQGVNVVARWIDPATNQPSGEYAASSVSGFLFTGNAGNSITGLDDSLGNPYADWGSTSSTVEGFFDLEGLQWPNGGTAQYQLSVEPVDSTWSAGVGSYAPLLVSPSGSFQPIVVPVSVGQQVEQDILMSASAQPLPQFAASETWTAPASIPAAGDWQQSLSGYGDASYFQLPAQANRTLSIAVTALDESGNPTESKAQPVVGMWAASDPEGTAPPALTTSPFNSVFFGVTRLDAQVNTASNFIIGISDMRGDGRPDYHYEAQVLYADSVSPARVPVTGGPVTISGTGFSQSLAVTIGNQAATPLAVDAGQMILALPPQSDGAQSIAITNAANGASSTMTNVLTYGAAATDELLLIEGNNPQTPVGTQATNPVAVQVVASDGVTPVAGATIAWTTTSGVQLSACSGTTSCSVTTDESGYASTMLTPTATGPSTITATLAPGAYSSARSVSATLSATESLRNIGVLTPFLWIAQGSTVSVPLTATVLGNGTPVPNATVDFILASGSATLSAPSATTNSNGVASVTLSLTQFAAEVQVNACVAPANVPCVQIFANPVPLSQLNLQPVAGEGQISTGQPFQPIVVRLVDSASPPHPVQDSPVSFQTIVMRPASGGSSPSNPSMPIILGVSQSTVSSDVNGLASIVPSAAGFAGPLEVDVSITAGTSAALSDPLQLLPPLPGANSSTGTNPQSGLRRRWPIEIGGESNHHP